VPALRGALSRWFGLPRPVQNRAWRTGAGIIAGIMRP
jgi:hypothetical protein